MVFGHLKLVHGQCAGLVGTDYGCGAHRLAGVQFAHQVVLFQHLAHAQRQTHGDAERQAFGHGHHHERDGDEDAVEQKLGQLERLAVVGHVAVEEEVIDHPAHDDEGGHDVAGPCNPAAQVVELLVERCAHGALLAEDFGAAALFGLGAHGRDPVVAVALYHGAAAQQEVARVGGVVGAVVAGGYAFGGEHLAGEGALVDVERERAQQLAVGGHLVAALQLHHIAHHHVAFLDLQYVGPVVARPAQHLDGSLVLALVEHAELALGAHFEDETHAGGQEQGHEHAGRFDEGGPGFAVQLNLIDGDAEREEEDHQEHDDERVFKLAEEAAPQRFALGVGYDVLPAALCHGRRVVVQTELLIVGCHNAFGVMVSPWFFYGAKLPITIDSCKKKTFFCGFVTDMKRCGEMKTPADIKNGSLRVKTSVCVPDRIRTDDLQNHNLTF